jgi:hypothetical protein
MMEDARIMKLLRPSKVRATRPLKKPRLVSIVDNAAEVCRFPIAELLAEDKGMVGRDGTGLCVTPDAELYA